MQQRAVGGLALVLFLAGLPLASPADALKSDIEAYFAAMAGAFGEVASSPVLQQANATATDRFFVTTLTRYPTLATLMRANAKGVLVNEVARGKRAQRVYRNVSTQRWFSEVKGWHDYHGFVTDKDGRAYLFWAKPIAIGTSTGARRFAGAAAVRLDLSECLGRLASGREEPLQVLVDGKPYLSFHWDQVKSFDQTGLDIAGLHDAALRAARPAPAIAPPAPAVQGARLGAATPPPRSTTGARKRRHKHRSVLMPFAVLVAVGAAVVALVRGQVRHRRILRELEHDDEEL
jgi:hypothetical protein